MTNQLKILRQVKDLTQAQLAAQIGVSRQTIVAIEKGKYVPSTLLALKLAQSLNCAVEEIFGLEEGD
jgi:Predicted transcriptional regulators